MKRYTIIAATIFSTAIASCYAEPHGNVAARSELKCLLGGGGPLWQANKAKWASLSQFCKFKAAFDREQYMKIHDPAELAAEQERAARWVSQNMK